MRSRRLLLGVLVFIAAAAAGAAAGVTIAGTIVDPSGSAIPGVKVELLSGTNVVASATSAADGTFSFPDVAPGSYEVRATLQGFRQTRVTMTVGSTAPPPLTVKLLIGSAEESIMVAGGSPIVDGRLQPLGGLPANAPPPRIPSGTPPPPPPAMPAPGTPPAPPQTYNFGGTGVANQQPFDTASYETFEDNGFRRVTEAPLSTFSIDVDTASYANVRRFLNEGRLPPVGAVRVEELVNYFHFDYADAIQKAPFGVSTEIGDCPWNSRHRLALIGLQAKRPASHTTPPRNLVFLIDVSGSMSPPDRLPLIKSGLKLFVDTLTPRDRVAIVTYAGTTGVALPATGGDRRDRIQEIVASLQAGGSTNGGAGIQLAYQIASENLIKDGVNRVILATDGDFNVGITNRADLIRMIEEKRASGVFLSVLGVGTDNLKDATMEQLADKGNGNYAYLDSLTEAHRVLVAESSSTLITVAKDVKIQVEFNPGFVSAYRLVGYENRKLRAREFNDDTRDAGELGAGHAVTALYEIVPVGEEIDRPAVDPLKYQRPVAETAPRRATVPSNELMTVKVRYKPPQGTTSALVEIPVVNRTTPSPRHLGFAAAVAEFGMLLRRSPYALEATWAGLERLAIEHKGDDADGYRGEFVRLVRLAAALDRQTTVPDARR